MRGIILLLILLLIAVNVWLVQRLPVSAAGETLTIAAPVVFSAGYSISSAQFIDSANSAYFIDPAATGNALVIAGSATISGQFTAANTFTFKSVSATELGLYDSTNTLLVSFDEGN